MYTKVLGFIWNSSIRLKIMKRILLKIKELTFSLVFIVLIISNTVFSQTEIYVKMPVGGYAPMDIGVAEFVPKKVEFTSAEKEMAQRICQVIREDLKFSLMFYVFEVDSFVFEVLKHDWGNLKGWYDIGAKTVLTGDLEIKGDYIDVSVKLHDVESLKKIFAHSYKTSIFNYRGLAHAVADDVVQKITGETPIFSTKIAFVSKRDDAKELYICDYDGENLKKLTADNSINLSPRFSPDSRKMTFTSYKEGNPDLWVLDLDRSENHKISSELGLNSAASWSPDGRQLALTLTKDGNAEIYLINQKGEIETRLTKNWSIDSSPCFSPNGKQIAFTSDRAGAPQIYVMDLDGSNVRKLTYETSYNDSPAWSPRGDKIAFVTRSPGGFDVCTIDITGENFMRLTSSGSNENPQWSPDGYHLVFSSNTTGKNEIYTMNWDGTNVKPITEGGENYNPCWSPSR